MAMVTLVAAATSLSFLGTAAGQQLSSDAHCECCLIKVDLELDSDEPCMSQILTSWHALVPIRGHARGGGGSAGAAGRVP